VEQLRFLAHLEDTDPSRFRDAMARLVAVEAWGTQVFADAQAWARERSRTLREQVFTELGYTNGEKRGRKTKRSATAEEDTFKVAVSFPQLSVQNKTEHERIASQLSVRNGKVILNRIEKNSEQKSHPYGPELQSSESQLASLEKVTAKPEASQAELNQSRARAEIKTEVATRLRAAKLTALGAVKMDAGTVTNLVNELIRLPTAGDVREVLDVFEERAREVKNGKRGVTSWGYLVNTVRGEVEKRLPTDLKTQVKAAAAAKGMP
jgi:hypothetical protein